jgi:uncharacterized protein YdhG (YjbR/CyaY superfamily)
MAAEKNFTTIDQYIKSFPPPVQIMLQETREIIQNVVPAAEETISYGIPTFKLKGKGLVSFAGWKHHIAMYSVPKGDATFRKEIAPYRAAKSSVHFPIGQPIPHDLVRKIVKFHLKERHGAGRS